VHPGSGEVPAFQLEKAELFVLGEKASDAVVQSARHFASSGKIVLVAMESPAAAVSLARLFSVPELSVTEAAVRNYAMFAQMDFQHSLFAPFADPRFSDFTKIHIWRYRQWDLTRWAGVEQPRVVARFDSGDPAVVQIPVGTGNVTVLTTTWRPVDSQLALSSKFVPLLHALLAQSSRKPLPRAQYVVGDEIDAASRSESRMARRCRPHPEQSSTGWISREFTRCRVTPGG
jgi:hypothetical protein